MSETKREGGCACGAARYQVVGEPIFVNNCHCTLCQRQTGAGSAVNAFFESERLTLLSGALARHVVKTGSGGDQIIVRCASCGTALWSHYPRLGEEGLALRVGTLDAPASVRPDAAIYVAERMPWTALPEGIPAFEESYRPADLLPPDRMARLRDVAARAAAL